MLSPLTLRSHLRLQSSGLLRSSHASAAKQPSVVFPPYTLVRHLKVDAELRSPPVRGPPIKQENIRIFKMRHKRPLSRRELPMLSCISNEDLSKPYILTKAFDTFLKGFKTLIFLSFFLPSSLASYITSSLAYKFPEVR